MPKKKEEGQTQMTGDPPSPAAEGNGGDKPKEGDQKDPSSQNLETDPTPTGETPFTHAALSSYKSEEELAEFLGVYEATVREQGAEVTRLTAELNKPVEAIPEPKDPTDVPAEEFWREPMANVRKAVEETVKSQLQEIIQPFRDDLAVNRLAGSWSAVRSRHPDLDQFKPMIDSILSRTGVTNPSEGQIEYNYYTAVGLAARNTGETVVPASPAPPPAPPPQHAPSNHPIAPVGEIKPELRPLTENEETLRRHNRQTHEEFLRLQGMDERDVLAEEPSND